MASIVAIVLVLALSLLVGSRGVRALRGTGDFLVAARSIGPRTNAVAVAGEYLSAASFLGVASAVMKIGIGGMWYPIGFTAGYVTLLALVAAPLRRFGGFTFPDFVEGRLGSIRLRRLVAAVAFLISGLYVVPQLKGAGVILSDVASVPYPVGVGATAAVIAGVVVVGGMRSATYLQAFEYAVKLSCVAIPALLLLIALHPAQRSAVLHADGTRFDRATTVSVPAHTTLVVAEPTPVVVEGRASSLPTGRSTFAAATRVEFAAGDRVPTVAGQAELGGATWQQPFIALPGVGHPLYVTIAIVLTLALGTAGLPHILVRFGTTPSGRDARRTAVGTVGLIGAFYLFPALYGLMGRTLAPGLYLTSTTDSVVAVLPGASGIAHSDVLGALTAAGAFAAFLSTSAGLLLTAGSAISHDVVGRRRAQRDGVAPLRWGVLAACVIAAVASLAARDVDISVCVSWAFSIAAATVSPLLVLSIWTDRLTPAGAAAGMVAGGSLAGAAVVASLVVPARSDWASALLAAPAPGCLAVAVVVMVGVSARTRRGLSRPTSQAAMARMHRLDPVG